jgi:hypothetical protein
MATAVPILVFSITFGTVCREILDELARHAEAKIVTAAARRHFAPSLVSVLFGRMPASSAV